MKKVILSLAAMAALSFAGDYGFAKDDFKTSCLDIPGASYVVANGVESCTNLTATKQDIQKFIDYLNANCSEKTVENDKIGAFFKSVWDGAVSK